MENSWGPTRKVSAIGVIGDPGNLFTVFERNWTCEDCKQENLATKPRCTRCKAVKPTGTSGIVMNPALEATLRNETIKWREAVDPDSKQIYYYNIETNQTQWDRPVEMGPAPVATGWIGRGNTNNSVSRFERSNLLFLSRPARIQKEYVDPNKYHHEGQMEYNIWYHKYVGDYSSRDNVHEKSETRCNPELDSGFTLADTTANPDGTVTAGSFCLFFARGACSFGPTCRHYHRVPILSDSLHSTDLYDVFGRKRHERHRDDMEGIGCWTKPCRTLYVSGIVKTRYASPEILQNRLDVAFSCFGEIESISFVSRLSVAFIRYRFRYNCEFARVAMQGQVLDVSDAGGENDVLNIKWAHDDENPTSMESARVADEDTVAGLVKNKVRRSGEDGSVRLVNYDDTR